MAFYNGKHKEEVRTVACSVVTALMLFMVVYPNLIYGSWNITGFFDTYWDFHTVFFHNVVIFEFILIIVLRLHHISDKNQVKYLVYLGVGYSIVAGSMSNILQVNFSKFLNCDDIPPVASFVNSIKDVIGQTAGQLVYVIILGVLHVLFFMMCYYLYRAIDKLNVKLRGKAEE